MQMDGGIVKSSKMCPQIDYALAALDTTAATTTATPVTTKRTVATTTTTTTNRCMCCYQLKAFYVKSSNHVNIAARKTTPTKIAETPLRPSTMRGRGRRRRRARTTTTTTSTATNGGNLWHVLAILTTLLAAFDQCFLAVRAAPQSCVLCDINDLKARVDKGPSSSYEEFLFEHQVTRQDAINALKLLNDSFYEGPSPEMSCKSMPCSQAAMKYCLSPQFINDHCWCELGHSDEGLPFIPHICYVGENTYSASVGSCFFYEQVKECCCAPVLAKQWRHISEGAATTHVSQVVLTLGLLVLLISSRSSF